MHLVYPQINVCTLQSTIDRILFSFKLKYNYNIQKIKMVSGDTNGMDLQRISMELYSLKFNLTVNTSIGND